MLQQREAPGGVGGYLDSRVADYIGPTDSPESGEPIWVVSAVLAGHFGRLRGDVGHGSSALFRNAPHDSWTA